MASEEPSKTGRVMVSPESATPSGTVTFLFTDIEGSTRLLERLRGRYAEVLAEQRRILRDAFAHWHGHEIDTQGDSFFVAFPRAADALRCAIEAQRALATWRWPGEVDVRVRMGIHTGEPLVAASGYVGMDVHRAARIAAVGHGGQILLSGTAHDLVADDLPAGIELHDLGTHRLKDLRAETRLYQVAGEGLKADFAPLVTGASDEPPPTPGEPPYRGLQAFEEHDAGLFFGREEIVAQLVERLRGARFLALIGASGSGKSSILRAGLIPALREEAPPWRVLLLTPTAHPLEALAGAIEPHASPARVAALVDDLGADPRSLAVAIRPKSGRDSTGPGRLLIAVDQLEEVFTLCRDEAERHAFLTALIHASGLDDGPADRAPDADRATVLMTLRADFYAFLAPYSGVREAAATSQTYVGAMSSDELRRAIEEPARRGGWEFAAGLVDLLLRDVGDEPGALPLLSHALLESWQRRRGTVMTLRSYAESGGVKGAIARTADRVYGAELSDAQRRIARDIFVRLTELGEGAQDTRRRARLDELMPDDPNRSAGVRTVIGVLADARLVTVGEDTVEVAHEALIREWPTLREWLRTDREGLRLHRRLTEAAGEWELSGFDSSLLFRGARLAQACESTEYKGVLNEIERRFLDASVALAEHEEAERSAVRQREVDAAQALAAVEAQRAEDAVSSARGLRRRAVLLAGALVVAGVLAGAAVILAQQSATNAALAEQSAQQARDNAALASQQAAEASDNAALADERAQQARDSEALAQAESTRALAQRLGSDATQVLSGGRDPELAALLALNGLRVGYTPQADATLQRAGRQLSGKVFQHDAAVDSMVVTPDGKTMITVAGGMVHIWDVDSGTQTQTFAAPAGSVDSGNYSYVELSGDGTILLASGYGGAGALYQLSGGEPAAAVPIARDCPSLDAPNGIRTISGDGRFLATVLAFAAPPPAQTWDVVIVTIPDCTPVRDAFQVVGVNDPTLSPDGSLLAGSTEDHSVMTVWDVATGQQRARFGTDIGQFWTSSFSADGTKLAVGSSDSTAHVFDALTGDLLQTYRGHADGVIRAVFSPNGSRLLTSSLDHTARLWDTSTITELHRFVHSDYVNQSAFSGDGRDVFTASADATARLWSAGATGEEFTFTASDAEVDALVFSPDGLRLATAGGDRTRVFNLASGSRVVDTLRRRSRGVAFTPDGASLLASSSFGASLLNASDGNEIRQYSESVVAGASIAGSFSADGRLVLASFAGGSSQVALYDSESGSGLAVLGVRTAVLSADGTRVAGWAPGRYSIYDASGNTLLSIGLVWAGTNGTESPCCATDDSPVDVAFTPDASRIVTGDQDNVVRVRDATTGNVLLELPGHGSMVRQVRVSLDGRYALTASDDGTARLWNLASGALIRVFPGHDGRPVTSIAISPDGRTVAIGSSDGTVIVTPVSQPDVTAQVCARLGRDLTDGERTAYGIESATASCP